MSPVSVFSLASILFVGGQAPAQKPVLSQNALCTNDRAQIDILTAQLRQITAWDDAKLAKAQASIANLEASRRSLTTLMRRLNSIEQSAGNAESFARTAEANFWKRHAADVRARIETERKKAKVWAADAEVRCPGCTYSVVISKVRTAIDGAVAARSSMTQTQQQVATYKSHAAAAGCKF